MAPFHEPLDIDSYEIRLLTIHLGPPASVVSCSIEKTSLINPISYAALSYCWGDEIITKDIIVHGIETPVTIKLADALQHLRMLGVSRVWANALCINQTDKSEKGLQIRNMRQIFSKADKTYPWLGKEEDTTAVTTFHKSLLNSQDDTAPAETPHTCQRKRQAHHESSQIPHQNGDCRRCTMRTCFLGLQRILQRPYWRRRWIIQETSVSYRPTAMR